MGTVGQIPATSAPTGGGRRHGAAMDRGAAGHCSTGAEEQRVQPKTEGAGALPRGAWCSTEARQSYDMSGRRSDGGPATALTGRTVERCVGQRRLRRAAPSALVQTSSASVGVGRRQAQDAMMETRRGEEEGGRRCRTCGLGLTGGHAPAEGAARRRGTAAALERGEQERGEAEPRTGSVRGRRAAARRSSAPTP